MAKETKIYIVISYMHTSCHMTEGVFSSKINAENAIRQYMEYSKLPFSRYNILEREIDKVFNRGVE